MSDAQIAAEIDALRLRYTETRELYREVCALLFFRYGITPTANKLYQYVRKGSMATPAQVLSRFWSDLRERTRVRIDHPDLPDELREAAGETALRLWSLAQEHANSAFAHQSAEAERRAQAAREQLREAEDRIADRDAELGAMQPEMARAQGQILDLGRQLATIQGRLASMTEMLRDQGDEMRELREELAASRRDAARAAGEANALRVQLALAKRRGSRKPLGGVPQDPDRGQEDLELERALPANDETGSPPENDSG
ncbi:MAG TPA: DNA-binding protein [Burkholderiaceae bacterium]